MSGRRRPMPWPMVAVVAIAAVLGSAAIVLALAVPSGLPFLTHDGEWVASEVVIDGVGYPPGARLSVSGDGIEGETFCNRFSGSSWDSTFKTLVGCALNGGLPVEADDRAERQARSPEARFMAAIGNGPSRGFNHLVFEAEGVRLVYVPDRLGD